jgi:hypothetical protein
MPWWLTAFFDRRSAAKWSSEERSVFFLIVLLAFVIFLVMFVACMLLFNLLRFEMHIGAAADFAISVPFGLWASRRLCQRYAAELCRRADANNAARVNRNA